MANFSVSCIDNKDSVLFCSVLFTQCASCECLTSGSQNSSSMANYWAVGKRSHGGKNKTSSKIASRSPSVKAVGVDTASWETLAQDRSTWRSATPKGSQSGWSEKTCRGTEETWAAQNQSCQHRELCTHTCLPVEILSLLGLASAAISEHTVHSQPRGDVNGPHRLLWTTINNNNNNDNNNNNELVFYSAIPRIKKKRAQRA